MTKDSTALSNLRLVESVDVKLQIRRIDYNVMKFSTVYGGRLTLTALFVQGSTVNKLLFLGIRVLARKEGT